jgi:hypothetical protein
VSASGAIGAADDFYRVRTIRVSEVDAPEFEWRDDVLWREPVASNPGPEQESFRVEAIAIDDDENVTVIGTFDSSQDAAEALETATEDLMNLTRSEFEERYFPATM